MRHPIARFGPAGAGLLLAMLAAWQPGLASAQETPQLSRQQARTVYNACRDDIRRLCPGVQRGGGAIAACMREHAASLSPSCTSALAEVKSQQ